MCVRFVPEGGKGGAGGAPKFVLYFMRKRSTTFTSASCFYRPDETCPVSTGGGTRRVQLVREGRAQ